MTWLDGLTLETVIVHTTHGTSVKGLKSAIHDDCVVLRDAFVFGEPEMDANIILNGEIVIPRERVLFMQRIAAPISEDGEA